MPSTARRAHHKSRGGCTLCKRKKIKCDEKQPCSYCVKKRLPCSLQQLRPAKNPSHGSGITISSQEQPSFAFSDFALFRHFVKSTAGAHADDGPTYLVWSETVPEMATKHQYLLHQVLALAALHLRWADPRQAEALTRVASQHQSQALPLFRSALSRAHGGGAGAGAADADADADILPLFACSCLIVPYHFAASAGDDDGARSLVLNDRQRSPSEWLRLLEGTAFLTKQYGAAIARSPLRALLGSLPRVDPDGLEPSDAHARLQRLKTELPVAPGKLGDYATAIDLLCVAYALFDRATTEIDRKVAALRWSPHVKPALKEDLSAKHPAALIVAAFWYPLLHRIENRWWLKGKITPIVLAIEELLEPEYRHFLRWPLEQVGGTPSTTSASPMDDGAPG
ncbi:hypothetical protein F4780DRAFT_89721 [Xylariomycetidae sp. FL0641]|nr:hypothetical protein F4780DRAFT_89721 [Xylariomycetidae sp. FL0641]